MDEVEVIDAVMNQELFEGISYDQIAQVYQAAGRRRLKPKAVLCEPLTIDDHIFILLAGRLRLESPEGVKLADIDPVHVVGEMGVLTQQVRTSRVLAAERSEVLAISREALEALAEEDSELSAQLLVNLCKLLYTRVHEMNDDTEALRRRLGRLEMRLHELSPGDPLLDETTD